MTLVCFEPVWLLKSIDLQTAADAAPGDRPQLQFGSLRLQRSFRLKLREHAIEPL